MPVHPEQCALIIFAREPEPGKVKTRLLTDFSSRQVTALYKAFVRDVLAVGEHVPCSGKFIFYAGKTGRIPFLQQFKQSFELHPQKGKDLGERMHRAFVLCKDKGFQRVLLIGTDCLALTPRDLTRAFSALGDHDCVLGPARDGGYYLVGLKKPVRAFFNGVAWGTADVLSKTLKIFAKYKKKVFLLPIREDIDQAATLRRFQRKKGHTYAIIKKLVL